LSFGLASQVIDYFTVANKNLEDNNEYQQFSWDAIISITLFDCVSDESVAVSIRVIDQSQTFHDDYVEASHYIFSVNPEMIGTWVITRRVHMYLRGAVEDAATYDTQYYQRTN